MSKAATPWYLDKSFYVLLLSFALPAVNAKLGIDLDTLKVAAMFVTAATYIASSKWKQWRVMVKELEVYGLKLAQEKLGPDPVQAKYLGATGAVTKALALALVVGVGLVGAPARASGFDYTWGPSATFAEYDFGNPHPVQVEAGAGLRLSVNHEALRVAMFGRAWDLISAQAGVFGSLVSSTASGQQFGAFSATLGPCFMSSAVCLGLGKHILSTDQVFVPLDKGWLVAVQLSFNWAGASISLPKAAPNGTAGLLRGNTLYLSGP